MRHARSPPAIITTLCLTRSVRLPNEQTRGQPINSACSPRVKQAFILIDNTLSPLSTHTPACPGTSAPHPIRGTVPYCTCEFKRLAAGSPGLQALWARLSGPCLTLWHMWLATGALTSACKHLTSLRSQHIVRNGAPCARRNHQYLTFEIATFEKPLPTTATAAIKPQRSAARPPPPPRARRRCPSPPSPR